MLKSVQIKPLKVKYIGGSIGDDIHIEIERWMEIYATLIKARKGDFMSVGILEVID